MTTLHTPPTPWLESAVSAAAPVASAGFVAISAATAALWRPRVPVADVILNGVDVDAWPFQPVGDAGTAVWVGRVVPGEGAASGGRRGPRCGPAGGAGRPER